MEADIIINFIYGINGVIVEDFYEATGFRLDGGSNIFLFSFNRSYNIDARKIFLKKR